MRWQATVAVAALALTACGGAGHRRPATRPPAPVPSTTVPTNTPAAAATGCGTAATAGQAAMTLGYQGQARSYLVYVPASYSGHQPVPVVFDFHGYGSSAAQQIVYGDFRALADRDGFLIVAPDGQGSERHYNLTGEAGLQDDVAFVGALVDHVEATLCIDTKRVYATGMSDGGAMSSVLACRMADRFAAFGAVAVELYEPGCAPGHDISIAAFHGTSDPIVPFQGGTVSCCGRPHIGSAPDAMAGWAGHDGCDARFTDRPLSSEVIERVWTGCHAGAEVRFYMIQGGGHTWPGAAFHLDALGLTTRQIDASATLWAFFQAHPLP